MKKYKQTFTVIGAEQRPLGVLKTTTNHSPLKQDDQHALLLAREIYGSAAQRVSLTTTEESVR